jgi:endo-1,4-beta-mannosidase
MTANVAGRWCTAFVVSMIGGAGMAQGFVTAEGARLMLDGREYRAVGVNVPHLHQAYLGTWFHTQEKYGSAEGARAAVVAAIEDAEASGLEFIRFFADPGYPRDRAMLYDRDPEAYWREMDELFALCREHHVRLIPSLQTIPGPFGHFGETGQAILDPNSNTYEAVHRYIREFVTRYRDDPTVLMWELLNEGMLRADVEMEGRKLLPAGVYPPGMPVREDGAMSDSLTWDMLLRLYREHAATIKSLDPNHLVTSGDAHVRPECTSRRETFPNFRFRSDTWREWLGNNLLSQPAPLDVFSFHFYGNEDVAGSDVPWAGMTTLEQMRGVVRCVHAANAPVFIGELGAAPSNQADPQGVWLCKALDAMEAEGVSLMALWVWHFNWQPELTMDSATYPEIVARAKAFNARYAGRD